MTRTAPRTTLLRLMAAASLLLTTAFVAPAAEAALSPKFDQCANTTGGTGPCNWISSNLQPNNSYWTEDDVVPQRLFLPGLTLGATYTLTLGYTATKGGNHAYDFLASYNASETWITNTERCTSFPADCSTGTDMTTGMVADPAITSASSPAETLYGSARRAFTMRGVTSLSAAAPTYFSGSYAADSEYHVDVTFTVAGTGSGNVYLWYGGHLATAAAWPGKSSSLISGASFHHYVIDLSGPGAPNLGNMDNPLMLTSSTPLPASLTVTKAVTGGSAPGLTYTIAYSCTLLGSTTTGTVAVAAGASATVDATAGSACTLTEPTRPTPPAGYRWGTVVFSPSSTITLGLAGETTAATVTNPLIAPGTLRIAEAAVTGATGTFDLTYTCTYGGATRTGPLSLAPGGFQDVTGITDGSTCSVTQTSRTGITLPANTTWNGIATYSAATASIVSGTTATITVTNLTNTTGTPPPPPAPSAGLTVTKAASLSKSGPWTSSIETEAGTAVWYRIVITNSGQLALTGLTVKDTLTDDDTPPDCPALPGSLAIGASWTCTYSVAAPSGTTINTVTADTDQTAPATASADVFGAEGETLPATDLTGRTPTDAIARYAPLGLGLLFAALLVALAMGLPERRRR